MSGGAEAPWAPLPPGSAHDSAVTIDWSSKQSTTYMQSTRGLIGHVHLIDDAKNKFFLLLILVVIPLYRSWLQQAITGSQIL